MGDLTVMDKVHLTMTTGVDPATGRLTTAWRSSAAGQRIEEKNWNDVCSKLGISDAIAIASFVGDGIGIAMLVNGNTVPGAIVLSASFVAGVIACVKCYVDSNRNSEYNSV